jgi:hypothetical protein
MTHDTPSHRSPASASVSRRHATLSPPRYKKNIAHGADDDDNDTIDDNHDSNSNNSKRSTPSQRKQQQQQQQQHQHHKALDINWRWLAADGKRRRRSRNRQLSHQRSPIIDETGELAVNVTPLGVR